MIEKFIAYSEYSAEKLKEINAELTLFKNTIAGSTAFPLDETPINTYGDQIMEVTYKPFSNNSMIAIAPVISIRAEQTAEDRGIFAVFINDNVYSQGGGYHYLSYDDSMGILYGVASYDNNSLDQITIKIRVGVFGSFGTTDFTFNPYLNGHTSSSLLVKEFQVLS